MMIPRLHDWDQRLMRFIEMARAHPFVWGELDCALFGAEAAGAMTGADPGALFRGRYEDARGALRVMRRFLTDHGALEDARAPGGYLGAVVATVCDCCNWPEHENQALTRRGDLVLLLPDGGDLDDRGLGGILGVCVGVDALFMRRPDDVVALPMSLAARAWGIG